MKPKEERRSEDMAEVVTVSGWACKKCRRWWGDDERMARYCCATSFPCECGGRYEKHRCRCDECQRKMDYESWYAKPDVDWDGVLPIGDWASDAYFFTAEELTEHLFYAFKWDETPTDEQVAEGMDSMRLTSCDPNNGRDFSLSEFLCDDLGDDQELDCDEVDKVVNEWIDANAPFSWSMTGKRLNVESVKRIIFPNLKVGE